VPFRLFRSPLPVAAAVVALALVLLPVHGGGSAAAHPLGNFTINHFTRIEVSETGIELYRVLEMAELPTFQEYRDMDTSGDDSVDGAEADAWIATKTAQLREGMTLAVNGDPVDLEVVDSELSFLPGDGGLQLLRFTVTYTAGVPDDWRSAPPSVSFEDSNYDDRIGWREVVVRGAPGVDIRGSSAPAVGISNELLSYPSDFSGSSPDVRAATFGFQPGAGSAPEPDRHPDEERATAGNPDGYLERFSNLIAEDELSFGFVAVALLGAMGFGAIHALSPGHGKTVVAAYLVGSRGTWRHALLLGLTVTATHTSSVYAIGLVTLYLSEYVVPEDLYPWMEIASGALIVGMGAWLLVARLRASGIAAKAGAWLQAAASRLLPARTAPGMVLATERGAALMWPRHSHGDRWHAHEPLNGERIEHHHHSGDEHEHDHDDEGEHKHGWGPAHSHAIPGADGQPVSVRQLIGLGVFGGILPCPSAIVVMLSAISLHRVGFGLLLIVAFSVGLAGVLSGIGFALVFARNVGGRLPLVRRLSDRASHAGGIGGLAVRLFPIVAAAFVAAAGSVVLWRGIVRL
jgi:ABC-type nickel/cobalt efflux system permease component RcnA